MDEINKEILKTFGHRLRVRVNGLCMAGNQVLLVRHRGIGANGEFWSPPGGGMQFGETATQALEREFREETGLEITVGRFLFVHEFVGLPLHAIELFFEVHLLAGTLQVGAEPEMNQPILQEVGWMDFEAIKRKPPAEVHQLFRHCTQASDLLTMHGYYVHQE